MLTANHPPKPTPRKFSVNLTRASQGYILALDQGTTSSRAIIFDHRMQMLAMAQKPIAVHTPKAGYVEQDANDIWQTQISTAQEAISKAGLLATDIDAIGITNQRETTILWDKITGKPVAPAIVWQDRRTHDWCEQLKAQGYESRVQQITGLRLDPYFSASKIAWLLAQDSTLQQRAQQGELAFGTVDSWLLYNLTNGQHAIDITNASRTLLMDIHTGDWSEELLERFNIPKRLLPTILPSNAEFGHTQSGLFAKKIPIRAILGDQQAALYGQGCVEPGMAKSTYGTGCFILMNTGTSPSTSQHHLITTVGWQTVATDTRLQTLIKPWIKTATSAAQHTTYALEGSVFMAGAIVQWLRDNLGIIQHSEDIETLAAQVPDSGGVTLIPAFTGLGAPYWRADATAQLLGMTRGTTKAHIARASLEAIALQAYDVLQAMQQDSPVPLTELRVDGGAATNNLLLQFQADILGVPVLRPTFTEATAKGAALLAGEAIGLYGNDIALQSWQLDRAFEPQISEQERQAIIACWHGHMDRLLDSH